MTSAAGLLWEYQGVQDCRTEDQAVLWKVDMVEVAIDSMDPSNHVDRNCLEWHVCTKVTKLI